MKSAKNSSVRPNQTESLNQTSHGAGGAQPPGFFPSEPTSDRHGVRRSSECDCGKRIEPVGVWRGQKQVMKPDLQSQNAAHAGVRTGFWLLLGAVVLLGVALVATRVRRSEAGRATTAVESGSASGTTGAKAMPDPVVAPDLVASVETNTRPATTEDRPVGAGQAASVPPVRIPAPELPAPSAESRQLVNGVWQLDAAAGPMTAERAAQWKQNLEQLVSGGAASVPAIAEFLKLNEDLAFNAGDSAMLGYGSARAVMLDALLRIGSPESIGVLGELLQTAAVPREIALLARNLEALAPEQYRAQAVEAARQSLAMAMGKKLEGFDVAPLFEVLQKYGGPGTLNDLEHATSQFNYYATLALGNLPDGGGVPSLIRMAELQPNGQSNPGRLQSLQVLAQLASSNPDARAALIEQARANQIGPNLWPYLSQPLSGDQAHVQDSVLNENLPALAGASTGRSHIVNNNQNFFYAPIGGGLTADQANQQLALVNELAVATSNADARRVLEQTRTLLEQRLAKATQPAAANQ